MFTLVITTKSFVSGFKDIMRPINCFSLEEAQQTIARLLFRLSLSGQQMIAAVVTTPAGQKLHISPNGKSA
jgi:hypothetical protein